MTLNYCATNLLENMEGIHTFSDQMLTYTLIYSVSHTVSAV